MFELFALIIVGTILLIASFTDLRTTEVPDWLTHGGIVIGVILHLVSAWWQSSWTPLIDGGIGLGVFVAFGCLMYYTGQWGGGDSKIMMAIGALLGLQFSFEHITVAFFFNVLIAGAVYGLVWTIGLAIFRRKQFLPAYVALAKTKQFRYGRMAAYGALALFAIVSFTTQDMILRFLLLLIGVMVPFLLHVSLFIKAVEKCMVRNAKPSELMEGDWIVKDVVVAGKRITGPKDLGVTLAQMKELKRLSKTHKITLIVKDGIPFVPSFLIAFVMTLWIGSPVKWLL